MPLIQLSERIGTRIAGKYQILRLVGEGGMGAVFEARHQHLNRRIAVKMMRTEFVAQRESVERFLREAQAATAIGHPNIVEVLDYGLAEDGAPFIVMAYLEGETLADRLYKTGRLDEKNAVATLRPIIDALQKAHERGIIHRDVKPENVFLAREGRNERAILMDFGVSKFRVDNDTRATLTQAGAVLGTPAYMSPEQAAGRPDVTSRTDVYSMGAMLYELLTGACPFQRENYNATLAAILTENVRPPSKIVPTISPAIEAVIYCAMARDAGDRFSTMAEMQAAMDEALVNPREGGPTLNRLPIARMLLMARLSQQPGQWNAPKAGAEHADKRARTIMLVPPDYAQAQALVGTPKPPPSQLRGLIVAALLFVAGIAMLIAAIAMKKPPRARPQPSVPVTQTATPDGGSVVQPPAPAPQPAPAPTTPQPTPAVMPVPTVQTLVDPQDAAHGGRRRRTRHVGPTSMRETDAARPTLTRVAMPTSARRGELMPFPNGG